jgi:tripartite-type tricarboxylate transporter receptor subunit TctC
LDVANWTALLAPAGTPAPIVSKLAAAVGEAMHDPELLKRFSLLGVEAAGDGPEVLAGEIRRTVAQWRDVVRTHNEPRQMAGIPRAACSILKSETSDDTRPAPSA